MKYGNEFGECIKLKTENKNSSINCKAWCLGDYLIGLEMEYSNIDSKTLNCFKYSLENHFSNYKIIWTKL